MGYPVTVGLYQTRIFYTVSSVIHRFQFYSKPVLPVPIAGLDPEDYDIVIKAGTSAEWWAALGTFLDVLLPFWSDTVAFSRAELWHYPASSFDATFLTAGDLSDTGDDGVNPPILAGEVIYTARTLGNNVIKLTMEETINAPGVRATWSAGAGAGGALGTYVLSASSMLVDRHGHYPIALMNFLPGQNEAIFKRRYRSG